MPTNKDLKRLVRTRMRKTGESYAAARAHVTGRRPVLPAGYEELAGMSDEAVRNKTARAWSEWVAVLDEAGATEMSHSDIARWLSHNHALGPWWTQMVAVGYERIRGLRAVGQGRDGAFSAGKSQTLPFPEAAVRRAFDEPALRARWLPGGDITPRGRKGSKTFRFSCLDGTRGEVRILPRGEGRTQVAIEHAGLPDADSVTERKRFWEERLKALRELLSSTAP